MRTEDPTGGAEGRRRLEPWPLALAALLIAMIGICVAFYHIAAANPDPLVSHAPRPGVER